ISLARACAWSRMVVACARASCTIFSASRVASSSFCWPFSAAARPSAIFVWRSSIAFMRYGQMKRMQNHTNTAIAIVWPHKVRLIDMQSPHSFLIGISRTSAAHRILQLADERVGEREVERDTHADHRDGVEQRHDQEHLGLQHRGELRLPCRAFEEAAAQEPHADADAQGAESDENRD